MAAGDINIQSIKIGNMDVAKGGKVTLAGFNIYYDILNPYGPAAEIRVIDPQDALSQNKLNGSYDQDVEIKFGGDNNIGSIGSGSTSLKLKMYKNMNLNDQSMHGAGSGHFKQYDIRCVSPEILAAQGNYVEKSFTGKTSEAVKHIVEKGFKSDKKFEAGDTDKRRLVIPRSHPGDAYNLISSEHVSGKYESSCFVLFQQPDQQGGDHKYIFKTFEELFEGQASVKLKQTTNLSYNKPDQQAEQNSIRWFKPSKNFDSTPRALDKSSEYAVDLTSHKVVAVNNPQKQNKFKFADSQGVYDQAPSYVQKGVPSHYIHDKANNKDKHKTSDAKTKRAAFLAHLAQNSAELETYYNPKITIGSMIDLDIPKKANSDWEEGEGQFNGKALVVAIRIKYRVTREPPNCTMILRVVKASYKEGGGGQG
jgi:hypothetical protein